MNVHSLLVLVILIISITVATVATAFSEYNDDKLNSVGPYDEEQPSVHRVSKMILNKLQVTLNLRDRHYQEDIAFQNINWIYKN